MEIYPNTTLEFVNHLKFIEETTDRLDVIEVDIEYAKEIYDIIEEFNVPVPVDEVEAYYNFGTVLTTLRNLCDKKIADKTSLMDKFNKQLSKDISIIIKEVGLIQDESIVSKNAFYSKYKNPTYLCGSILLYLYIIVSARLAHTEEIESE